MNLKNKNVIITGSTGGLGYELAIKYLNEGANLILIGRDQLKLNNLKSDLKKNTLQNQFIVTIKLDLSKLNSITKIINKELKNITSV